MSLLKVVVLRSVFASYWACLISRYHRYSQVSSKDRWVKCDDLVVLLFDFVEWDFECRFFNVD